MPSLSMITINAFACADSKLCKGHQYLADRELWKPCEDIQRKYPDVGKSCKDFCGRCEHLSARSEWKSGKVASAYD